jgi:hypothetical protein
VLYWDDDEDRDWWRRIQYGWGAHASLINSLLLAKARSPKCYKHAHAGTTFVVHESWERHVLDVGAKVTVRFGSWQPKFRNANFDSRHLFVDCGPSLLYIYDHCHYYQYSYTHTLFSILIHVVLDFCIFWSSTTISQLVFILFINNLLLYHKGNFKTNS